MRMESATLHRAQPESLPKAAAHPRLTAVMQSRCCRRRHSGHADPHSAQARHFLFDARDLRPRVSACTFTAACSCSFFSRRAF